MKAIVAREFGGPDKLIIEEVPIPEPGPGQIRIRVHAVSVNSTLDVQLVEGRSGMAVELPVTPGVDPSGIVDAVGPDVTRLKPGDRVAANAPPPVCGGYAEFVVVDERNALVIPPEIDFPSATIVRRHFGTARIMVQKANIQSGEWVLVMGAAGAVGTCLVQFAKEAGATVIAGAGSDTRVETARSLGADHGINYRAHDLKQEVMSISDGRGVDVVFENIGSPDQWPLAVGSLARGGRLLTIGTHGGEGILPVDVRALYRNRLTITSGLPLTGRADESFDADIAGVISKKYQVLIDRVLPLAEAGTAFDLVRNNATLGKVIIDPTQN